MRLRFGVKKALIDGIALRVVPMDDQAVTLSAGWAHDGAETILQAVGRENLATLLIEPDSRADAKLHRCPLSP